MPVEQADIKIGIDPIVLDRLAASRWEEAREAAQGLSPSALHYHVDGIAVKAGPSWLERFADLEG